ncbi:MAG: hypothetical protein K6G80_11750 [Treponema sp.]|nr:hypothetical protein [Treponema sp.]
MVKGDLINEFVDADVVKAMDLLLTGSDIEQVRNSAKTISRVFLGGVDYDAGTSDRKETEKHLISSFQKNTALLVQKTWVEKDDVALKEQVLYKLEQLSPAMAEGSWNKIYPTFREIIIDIVYLMFGTQSKSKDFDEYALRIDPEFGIFWWYFSNLPESMDWNNDKCFYALLSGIVFLANY